MSNNCSSTLMCDILKDAIHGVLCDHACHSVDTVVEHYILMFIKEGDDSWESLIESIDPFLPLELDTSSLVDGLKSVRDIWYNFRKERELKHSASSIMKNNSDNSSSTSTVSAPTDSRRIRSSNTMNLDEKQRIIKQYSWIPDKKPGNAPVLDHIEYLRVGKTGKNGPPKRRYLNNCLVTEKEANKSQQK